jgi:hypothetical protein
MLRLTSLAAGLAILGLAVPAGLEGSAKAPPKVIHHQSHIHHALHALKAAHHDLKESRHEYGGHKAKALKDIHAAIHQLEVLVKHEPKHASAKPVANTRHEHPHSIHHALHASKHARHEIHETKHDFGGHKKAALHDVDAAIHQLEIIVKHHPKA